MQLVTLSRGNLLCPREARVILWEPTKLKLLERRVLRVGGAAAGGRRSARFRSLYKHVIPQHFRAGEFYLLVRLLLDFCRKQANENKDL